MLSQKLITSPIEHRMNLARENVLRGALYYVKDYNLWIISKHYKNGKFIRPTKEEMIKYNYRMKEFINDWVDSKFIFRN
jgi:hypothetical protein